MSIIGSTPAVRNKMMVVVDTQTGKVLATVPVGTGVDGAAFDAQLGLAAIPNGRDGTLTVVKEAPAGTFKRGPDAQDGHRRADDHERSEDASVLSALQHPK